MPEAGDGTYRLLVESLQDHAVFMLDPEGRIVTWNPGAERIKGYAAEEVIGRSFTLFYTPEDVAAEHPKRELEIATRTGRYEEEGSRVRKDGSRFWANVTITAVRGPEGELRGFAKVTRDFSDRRVAQEDLRRSEERFRLLVESVKDYAIFMLDPGGHIISWNAGAERLKGYRAAEIIGSHFSIFYSPDAVAAGHPRRELEIAMADGRYEEEGWRFRKDGSRFWANVTITAVRDGEGTLRGFAKVTRDFTERRRAEDELRDNQRRLRELAAQLEERVQQRTAELVDANKELEAFSYSVSHDLRAPLRALDGFSKMVLRSAGEKLAPDERDKLERVRSAAQRMSHLIDDMLSLSRLARAQVTPERVDVTAIATAILCELRDAEPLRAVETTVAPGLTATADPRLLRILLENLLRNAWKFTRRQQPGHITVGQGTEVGRTVFFVRDDGVGFDMSYVQNLFIPFQRLHSAREFEGTGVGLATVNRIVRRHGGKVWAESRPSEGATFYFTLPGCAP